MPSITYWNRIEPRPRALSIADTLAARVRDPLWLLARQWQFGEFRGEDAGSPAFAQVAAGLGHLQGWSTPDGEVQPLVPGAPLEPVVLAEDADELNLALAVELGQVFEQALRDLNPTLIGRFRASYRVEVSDSTIDARDAEARSLLELAAERTTHGMKLFLAAERALPNLPVVEPALDADEAIDVRKALERLRSWVRETIGRIGGEDAAAWVPERLEYSLAVTASEPDQGSVVLSARPDRDGRCEWHAFDLQAPSTPASAAGEGIERIQRSVIPASAGFRGMPSPRWWAFDSGATNLAAIRPEKRELAKLVVLDFMLVHSNDWFVVSFAQPLGTLCSIESLIVHDVFGGLTLVERADRGAAPAGRRWTMFSSAVAGTTDVAGFFFLPPTVGSGATSAEPVEEVRFIRDEMANLAWGVERCVPNAIGEPWPGSERSAGGAESEPAAPVSATDGNGVPLHYLIQTTVPEH
jgi:hypothetical protein